MSDPAATETDTRQRVLESATRLFAERGFRETTVHEICEQAGANIAAVNYYFGSKEKLYDAAWRYAYEQTTEARSRLMEQAGDESPEEQIRVFVRGRLDDVSSRGPASYFWRLLEHEHHDPTGAHEAIVREVFRPMGIWLAGRIAEILDVPASAMLLKLSLFSLIAPMGFLTTHRPIIRRVFGHDLLEPDDCSVLYDHIMRFFFAGLRDTRQALEEGSIARPLAEPAADPKSLLEDD